MNGKYDFDRLGNSNGSFSEWRGNKSLEQHTKLNDSSSRFEWNKFNWDALIPWVDATRCWTFKNSTTCLHRRWSTNETASTGNWISNDVLSWVLIETYWFKFLDRVEPRWQNSFMHSFLRHPIGRQWIHIFNLHSVVWMCAFARRTCITIIAKRNTAGVETRRSCAVWIQCDLEQCGKNNKCEYRLYRAHMCS